ncbi:MAG TPA: GAF domain-containing protein, partial [Stellaceae bacterium]|nr:GAF domain-containing protein [Stellaceae bacterium]
MATPDNKRIKSLEQENAELRRQLAESAAQQAATAEVLGVINSSAGELAPVFDSILEKARRLCGAAHGDLWTYDGEMLHLAASHGEPEFAAWLRAQGPVPVWPGSPAERLLRGADHVQFENPIEDGLFDAVPEFLAQVKRARVLSTLFVPMRKDNVLVGTIIVYRREVRRFTEKQIALLQNFAAEAVIAMENARLITETRERTFDLQESLEYQTAISDVLQVISRSTFDLQPVLDTLVATARGLCNADMAMIYRRQGDAYRLAANLGFPAEYEAFARNLSLTASRASVTQRAALERRISHVPDIAADLEYALPEAAQLGKARTALGVPLLREGEPIGVFTLARERVEPFTARQIELVRTFADQAVIAIENARLIAETREALEQQTATSEVLEVINASPGDLGPVFDAMLEKAIRLCEAAFGHLWLYDGGHFRFVAQRGVPPELAKFLANAPVEAGHTASHQRVLNGEDVVHVRELVRDETYQRGNPIRRALVDLGKARALLSVALRHGSNLLGVFSVFRREASQFTDKQIVLLQNFAAQAVIAMENARLITETREALEQQTATSDVLKVISQSTFDLEPVLQTVLDTAMRLCGNSQGSIFRLSEDGLYRQAVGSGMQPEYYEIEAQQEIRSGSATLVGRTAAAARPIQIADAWADPDYAPKDDARVGQLRSMLGVPLLREGTPIGVICTARTIVQPFTEKEIELVATFADQAVIAIENARLLGDLRERTDDLTESLEYQTATSDVLQVISRSTFDLEPVLDTLCQTAARLCGAEMGFLAIRRDGAYRYVATYSLTEEWEVIARDRPLAPDRGTTTGRALLEGRVIHIDDVNADSEYAWPEAVSIGKVRTTLAVPLLREGEPIGVITFARHRVEPFTERQIELVRTFADQAVIAIENARLITETHEALEQQTATAEVLGVINSSPGDLAPVFDAMLEKALELCSAAFGVLWTYDGEFTHAAAIRGATPAYREFLNVPQRPGPGSAQLRLMEGERFVHVADLADSDDYRSGHALPRALVDLGGGRALLAVPLRKDGGYLGAIMIYRQEPGPFTDKQIALLQNFAAQAVIAMENARLMTETREALEQQTATAEVLGVINSSPGDLAPVFDAILDRALRLCDAAFGTLFTRDGDAGRLVAWRNVPEAFAQYLIHNPMKLRTILGPNFRDGPVIHIEDLAAGAPYRDGIPLAAAAIDLGGIRGLLVVPLMKDATLIGLFAIYRHDVRAFTEKQIALLQTFAAQAVIAIENARLITETREALDQQTATAEVLGVINASPGDLTPVFDA